MRTLKVAIMALAILGVAFSSYGSEAARTATILDIDGSVSVRLSDGISVPAEIGMEVGQGDAIATGSGSFALVRLEGMETATVEVSENSRVLLSELIMNESDSSQRTLLDLAMGKVLIKADKLHNEKSKFEVKTPTSVVGVRGTTFEVQVEGME
ncbi:MAG TPA: FecR domain-containing protein [Candidatus Omnitrophota bacterium]|nr:FecR domain-containing protein [Candidatus Omnitrophota bacterium]